MDSSGRSECPVGNSTRRSSRTSYDLIRAQMQRMRELDMDSALRSYSQNSESENSSEMLPNQRGPSPTILTGDAVFDTTSTTHLDCEVQNCTSETGRHVQMEPRTELVKKQQLRSPSKLVQTDDQGYGRPVGFRSTRAVDLDSKRCSHIKNNKHVSKESSAGLEKKHLPSGNQVSHTTTGHSSNSRIGVENVKVVGLRSRNQTSPPCDDWSVVPISVTAIEKEKSCDGIVRKSSSTFSLRQHRVAKKVHATLDEVLAALTKPECLNMLGDRLEKCYFQQTLSQSSSRHQLNLECALSTIDQQMDCALDHMHKVAFPSDQSDVTLFCEQANRAMLVLHGMVHEMAQLAQKAGVSQASCVTGMRMTRFLRTLSEQEAQSRNSMDAQEQSKSDIQGILQNPQVNSTNPPLSAGNQNTNNAVKMQAPVDDSDVEIDADIDVEVDVNVNADIDATTQTTPSGEYLLVYEADDVRSTASTPTGSVNLVFDAMQTTTGGSRLILADEVSARDHPSPCALSSCKLCCTGGFRALMPLPRTQDLLLGSLFGGALLLFSYTYLRHLSPYSLLTDFFSDDLFLMFDVCYSGLPTW